MKLAQRIFVPLLLAVAALATSCAGTSSTTSTTTDVDATPTARIKLDAHVGKAWNADSTRIDNISDSFTANETVYAVVDVPGDKAGSLRAKWVYQDGTTVHEESKTIQAGVRNYSFRLAPTGGLKAGDYKLEVYANDTLEETESFKVAG